MKVAKETLNEEPTPQPFLAFQKLKFPFIVSTDSSSITFRKVLLRRNVSKYSYRSNES